MVLAQEGTRLGRIQVHCSEISHCANVYHDRHTLSSESTWVALGDIRLSQAPEDTQSVPN
jgi:hypothetical protein